MNTTGSSDPIAVLRRVNPVRTAAKAADSPAVRVLLADRQGLVRAGFRLPLDATERIGVVGEAASGDERSRTGSAPTWRRPPGCSGVSASAYIRAEHRDGECRRADF